MFEYQEVPYGYEIKNDYGPREAIYWLYTYLVKAKRLYNVSLWVTWSWNGPNKVESEWETYIG